MFFILIVVPFTTPIKTTGGYGEEKKFKHLDLLTAHNAAVKAVISSQTWRNPKIVGTELVTSLVEFPVKI